MSAENNISSSEMTAYWRSIYPDISQDSLRGQLASQEGIEKAKAFEEKYTYPKVSRRHNFAEGKWLKI